MSAEFKKRTAVLLLVMMGLGYAVWSGFLLPNTRHCKDWKSVTTYGYDTLRSGSVESCIGPRAKIAGTAKVWANTDRILESQLLAINNDDGGEVVYLTDANIVFRSLKDPKRAKKIRLGIEAANANSSTPVFDENTGTLYGSVFYLKKTEFVHRIFSINRADLKLKFIDVPADSFSDTKIKLGPMLHCRSSMALDPKTKTLAIGCSLKRPIVDGKTILTANNKGVRGGLLLISLTNNGELPSDPAAVRFFSPSKITKDLSSGQDSSVWMSGAAPAITQDGKFLFSTGNGKINPQDSQFGCSVLMVDPKSGELLGGVTPALVEPGELKMWCEAWDQGLSASAVTIIHDSKKKEWVAVNGKDGIFRVFQKSYFNDPKNSIYRWFKMVEEPGFSFGQPLGWLGDDDALNWVSAANRPDGWKMFRFRLDPSSQKLEKIWEVEGPKNLNRVSPVLVRGRMGANRIITSVQDSENSELWMLDAESGKVISREKFRGMPHFSMPTVLGQQVLWAVPRVGIVEFKIE